MRPIELPRHLHEYCPVELKDGAEFQVSGNCSAGSRCGCRWREVAESCMPAAQPPSSADGYAMVLATARRERHQVEKVCDVSGSGCARTVPGSHTKSAGTTAR